MINSPDYFLIKHASYPHHHIILMELSASMSQQVSAVINSQRNKEAMEGMMGRLGRLWAKKKQLDGEYPVVVYEDRIWLGNYSFANNQAFLAQNKIDTVVSCLDLPIQLKLPNVKYHRIPLKDNEDPNFAQSVKCFESIMKETTGNIFVHCFAGVSRSVALVISYMMQQGSSGYDQTLSQLRQTYAIAKPNIYFQSYLKSLKKVEENQVQTKSSVQLKKETGDDESAETEKTSLVMPQIIPQQKEAQKEIAVSQYTHKFIIGGKEEPDIESTKVEVEASPVDSNQEQIESEVTPVKKGESQQQVSGYEDNKNPSSKLETSGTFYVEEKTSKQQLNEQISRKSVTQAVDEQVDDLQGQQGQANEEKEQVVTEPIINKIKIEVSEATTVGTNEEQSEIKEEQSIEDKDAEFIKEANFTQKKRKPKKKKR